MWALSPFATVVIAAIVMLIVAHSLYLAARGRWLAVDPLNAFWGGIVVVYVMQPIAHANVLSSWHAADVIEDSLLYTLFGLLCVVIGYESDAGVATAALVPQTPWRLRGSSLLLFAFLFSMLGVGGYLYQFASAGGVDAWLSVARGGTDWSSVSVYLAQLADLLPFGVSLFLLRANLKRVSLLEVVLAWIAAALIWAWLIYLGSRSRTIVWAGVMGSCYYLPKRRNPPMWLLAAGFVALLLLTGFITANRTGFTGLSLNLERTEAVEVTNGILPTERDVTRGLEFNCVVSVVEQTRAGVPYNYGYGFLEFFTRPIPRALWPNKRYPALESVQTILWGAGLSTAKVRENGLLMGPAFTFVGHWFYVGGPLALLLGGLFTGVLLRLLRNIYDRRPGSEGDLILFSNLFFVGFSEAAATPLSFLYTLPYVILPIMLLFFAATERTPGPAVAARAAP